MDIDSVYWTPELYIIKKKSCVKHKWVQTKKKINSNLSNNFLKFIINFLLTLWIIMKTKIIFQIFVSIKNSGIKDNPLFTIMQFILSIFVIILM
jgi:hypothetical protein